MSYGPGGESLGLGEVTNGTFGGPLFIGAAREIKHLPLASIRDGTGD